MIRTGVPQPATRKLKHPSFVRSLDGIVIPTTSSVLYPPCGLWFSYLRLTFASYLLDTLLSIFIRSI
jgi:hypothetical protein